MGAAIAKYDFVLAGVLRVVFYRSLHMVSVPFKPEDVLAYVAEQQAGEGHFGGTLEPLRVGPVLGLWMWKGIVMGEGIPMDMFIFGARRGAQTVFVRKGWWRGNFGYDSLRAVDVLRVLPDA